LTLTTCEFASNPWMRDWYDERAVACTSFIHIARPVHNEMCVIVTEVSK
jgi:hypothetical protein